MLLPVLAVTATSSPYWPFAILAVCVATVITMIYVLRLHPFVALITAALLAGFMSTGLNEANFARHGKPMPEEARANSWVATVEITSLELGSAAGSIAISIGLASIIGLCLMESGAADKVVRRFLAFFGEKRAGLALLTSTYFLSIPIFFDTMFMLMVPLARALRLRTGKDYLLYLMCICCGGVITHSLTVPHPGPLAAIATLNLDAGLSLIWGIGAGLVPCLCGYFVAQAINRWTVVPLREVPGASLEELEGISNKPESALPSFFWAIIPVILPIALISCASFFKMSLQWPGVVAAFGGTDAFNVAAKIAFFLGNKNIALLIGTVIALWVLFRQRGAEGKGIDKLLGPPIETAGVIILITAAGGAFGGMLRNAGVGDAITAATAGYSVNFIFLGWLVAVVLRIAQGSATVAMLTTASILAPMLVGADLPYHPMYLFLGIGFGAFCCSWMNDSGFWVVSRLGGLTERETLRSWTVLLTCTSIIGLIFTMLAAAVLPMPQPPTVPL